MSIMVTMPMQRLTRFVTAGLFLALWLAPPLAQAGERLHGQGRLWQVARDGLAPSYLFGTMHSSEASVTDLPPAVARAFDGAGGLVLEVILDQGAQIKMGNAMMLSDGRSLSQIIGPELSGRVAATAGRYGLPPAQLQLLRPWAVMAIFSLPPAELARQQAGQQPLDQLLQARAAERGTPVSALESVEEQLDVFAGLREADQIALLEVALALNPQVEDIFARMKSAYLAGDLAALHDMAKEQQAGGDPVLDAFFERRLIETRNHRMAARLAPHLARGGAFVAVGALHLSGEEGLLNLFEQQGYVVERVL